MLYLHFWQLPPQSGSISSHTASVKQTSWRSPVSPSWSDSAAFHWPLLIWLIFRFGSEDISWEGFPGGSEGKESACNAGDAGRLGFDSLVRKIPWRRTWQPTPVFLPGESPWTEEPGGLQFIESQRVGHKWLSMHPHPSCDASHEWSPSKLSPRSSLCFYLACYVSVLPSAPLPAVLMPLFPTLCPLYFIGGIYYAVFIPGLSRGKYIRESEQQFTDGISFTLARVWLFFCILLSPGMIMWLTFADEMWREERRVSLPGSSVMTWLLIARISLAQSLITENTLKRSHRETTSLSN